MIFITMMQMTKICKTDFYKHCFLYTYNIYKKKIGFHNFKIFMASENRHFSEK